MTSLIRSSDFRTSRSFCCIFASTSVPSWRVAASPSSWLHREGNHVMIVPNVPPRQECKHVVVAPGGV